MEHILIGWLETIFICLISNVNMPFFTIDGFGRWKKRHNSKFWQVRNWNYCELDWNYEHANYLNKQYWIQFHDLSTHNTIGGRLWHAWYTRLRWHGLSPVVPTEQVNHTSLYLMINDGTFNHSYANTSQTLVIQTMHILYHGDVLGEMLYFKWITTECTNHEWLGHIYINALCNVSPRRRVVCKCLQTILMTNSCGKVQCQQKYYWSIVLNWTLDANVLKMQKVHA